MGYTLNKPTVFIMLGFPGAGKTYFSRRIAQKLGVQTVQSDRTRAELFNDPSFSVDEESVVDRMLYIQIEQLMNTGSSFVLDGDFMLKKSRRQVYQMAKSNGYTPLVIWAQTDIDTCFSRAKKRDKRNPDNEFNVDMSAQIFDMLAAKLKKPNGEPFIVISGKHDFTVQLRSVVSRLQRLKLISKAATKPESSTPLKEVMSAVNPKRRARSLDTIPVSDR